MQTSGAIRWLSCILAIVGFVGCATTAVDYSLLSDEQLSAEYRRVSRSLPFAEAQANSTASQYKGDFASGLAMGLAQGQRDKLYRQRDAISREMAGRLSAYQNLKLALPSPVQQEDRDPVEIAKSILAEDTDTDKGSSEDMASKQSPAEDTGASSTPDEVKRQLIDASVYRGSLNGHFVQMVVGNFIVLEDGSVWESSSAWELATWVGLSILPIPDTEYPLYRLVKDSSLPSFGTENEVTAWLHGWLVEKGRVEGDFEGWDGDTVVVMDNGHIWQQTGVHFGYTYRFRPQIIVFSVLQKLHYAVVEGDNSSVCVRRLN